MERGNKYTKKYEKKEKDYSGDYIFGVRAVIEAIRAGRGFNKILIQKGMDKELFLEIINSDS